MKHTTSLIGLATAVPEHSGSQIQSLAFMRRVLESHGSSNGAVRLLEKIHAGSEIEKRHSVIPDFMKSYPEQFVFFPKNWNLEPFPTTVMRMKLYELKSVELAAEAAIKALDQAKIEPSEITHLVISTCTGFFAPGLDIMLIKRLGLSSTVSRTLIGFMGCYAGFNGMRAADHIIRGDRHAIVLQICVELCSIHFQKEPKPEFLISNSLFADGACAVVYRSRTLNDKPGLADLTGTFSFVDDDSLPEMQWHIGDHGFEMILSLDIPKKLRAQAPAFLKQLLMKGKMNRNEIEGWVIHPGGKKIIEAVQEALNLENPSVASSFQILKRYGNMSSPTIFFVLEEELRKKKSGPIVALGFGPGLTLEGSVFNGFH